MVHRMPADDVAAFLLNLSDIEQNVRVLRVMTVASCSHTNRDGSSSIAPQMKTELTNVLIARKCLCCGLVIFPEKKK